MVTSTTSPPAARPGTPDPGVEGSERLTGLTGALLLLPLAVEGVTILRIGQLISRPMFLGLVLLAPIGLGSSASIQAEYRPGRRDLAHLAGARRRAVLILTVVLAGVILAGLAVPEFASWHHVIGHRHDG